MRHLLAKDVRLVAPLLWLIVPAHVLLCAQSFLVPELDFWMNLAAALAWTVAVVAIEWQFDADRLLASLPVTRAAIVKARYVSALAGLALGAGLYAIYGRVVMAIAAERILRHSHGDPAWASVDGVGAFLVVGYILVVGFLPFHFRFGLPFGATLFAASSAIAVGAASGLARLRETAGRLADVQSSGGVTLQPSEIIRGWLSSFAASWGAAPATLAIAGAAVAIGLLSVRLSLRAYRQRNL